jgi:hypothetical protein
VLKVTSVTVEEKKKFASE